MLGLQQYLGAPYKSQSHLQQSFPVGWYSSLKTSSVTG